MTRAHPRRGAGSARQAPHHGGAMPRLGSAAQTIRMRGANDNRVPWRYRLRQWLGLAAIAGLGAGLAALIFG